MFKKNKKAFTMVEILAVIVILGILAIISVSAVQGIIAKARDRYYISQEENMVMAAQSYLKNNNKQNPKVSGQIRIIKLKTLYDAKYIDKVVDYKKAACNATNSYVKAFKYEDEINYTAYLECPNYTTSIDKLLSSLTITGEFYGTNQSPKNAKATITIEDSNNNDNRIKHGIISYQYSVYKDKKLVYSSDVFNTKKTSSISKTISLSDKVPGDIKITVTATNVHGLTKTETFTKEYKDNDPPSCKPISGTSDTWSSGTRKVTVKCEDKNGSGCKRETYTYEFTGDVEMGYVSVEDKAGNKGSCKVSVHLDNSPPVVTLKAYKKKAGELAPVGEVQNQVSNSKTSPVNSLTITRDTVKGWLNGSRWTNGVYLELSYSDLSSVKSVEWKWNQIGLKQDDPNVKKIVQTSSTQKPNNATGKVAEKIEYDGYRYGEIIITDQFNHQSVIKVTAPLDRVAPSMTVTGDSTKWINKDRTIKIGCNDALSGCKTKPFTDIVTTTLKTKKYSVEDNAGNIATNAVNTYVDKTKPKCGNVNNASKKWTKDDRNISVNCSDDDSQCTQNSYSKTFNTTLDVGQIEIKDKAGNTRSCPVDVYVDKIPPKCNGSDGSKTWTNKDRTITLNCYDANSGCKNNTVKQKFTSNTKTANMVIEDKAGWTTNCSVNVYIDKSAPKCGTKTGEGSNSSWTNGNRTITVACNDDGESGCSSVSKTYKSDIKTDTLTLKDGAGNTASCGVNVYIDKTKPSISKDIYKIDDWGNWVGTYNSGEWSTRGIRRKLYPSDNSGGSGINHTEWSSDGWNWNYEGNVAQWDFHDGTNDTYFRTIDNAGNVSNTIHFVLKVDKYAPSYISEINYYDYSGAWGGARDRFGWNMYENASGLHRNNTIFEYCYSAYTTNPNCGATCSKGNKWSHRPAYVDGNDWHYFQDAWKEDGLDYQTGYYELSAGAVCNVSGQYIRTHFRACDHAGNCDTRSKIYYK